MDAYLDAIKVRNASGDYERFEVALRELAIRSFHRYLPFAEVHVVQTRRAESLSEREAVFVEEAVVDLLVMMPVEIRVPSQLVRAERYRRDQLREVRGREMDSAALARRDAEIRRLKVEEGWSVQRLAAEFRLGARVVQKIVYESAA